MATPESIIKLIFACAMRINDMMENVKRNNEDVNDLSERIQALTSELNPKKFTHQGSMKVLGNLLDCIEKCEEFVKKYSTHGGGKQFLKSGEYSKRLTELKSNLLARQMDLNTILNLKQSHNQEIFRQKMDSGFADSKQGIHRIEQKFDELQKRVGKMCSIEVTSKLKTTVYWELMQLIIVRGASKRHR